MSGSDTEQHTIDSEIVTDFRSLLSHVKSVTEEKRQVFSLSDDRTVEGELPKDWRSKVCGGETGIFIRPSGINTVVQSDSTDGTLTTPTTVAQPTITKDEARLWGIGAGDLAARGSYLTMLEEQLQEHRAVYKKSMLTLENQVSGLITGVKSLLGRFDSELQQQLGEIENYRLELSTSAEATAKFLNESNVMTKAEVVTAIEEGKTRAAPLITAAKNGLIESMEATLSTWEDVNGLVGRWNEAFSSERSPSMTQAE